MYLVQELLVLQYQVTLDLVLQDTTALQVQSILNHARLVLICLLDLLKLKLIVSRALLDGLVRVQVCIDMMLCSVERDISVLKGLHKELLMQESVLWGITVLQEVLWLCLVSQVLIKTLKVKLVVKHVVQVNTVLQALQTSLIMFVLRVITVLRVQHILSYIPVL
jgi:hypothetical protein